MVHIFPSHMAVHFRPRTSASLVACVYFSDIYLLIYNLLQQKLLWITCSHSDRGAPYSSTKTRFWACFKNLDLCSFLIAFFQLPLSLTFPLRCVAAVNLTRLRLLQSRAASEKLEDEQVWIFGSLPRNNSPLSVTRSLELWFFLSNSGNSPSPKMPALRDLYELCGQCYHYTQHNVAQRDLSPRHHNIKGAIQLLILQRALKIWRSLE